MAIKSRPVVRAVVAPVRMPPTQSVMSLAAYALADELGGRDIPQADRDAAAGEIYEFAAKSVATAWSLVDAAIMAVRCRQARRKLSGVRGEIVPEFLAALDKSKAGDLKRRGEILGQLKAVKDDVKASLEAELKELTLRGIKQGRPWKLGEKAMAYLVTAMLEEFLPVKGTLFAKQDFPRFVAENIRFLDWLGVNLLFTEEQNAGYQGAKDADKAARAAAGAEAAPEADADVEVESDEDETAAEVEGAEEPAAEEQSA
jgi:hypothetical protein